MAKGINFKFPLRSENAGFFAQNDTTVAAIREDIKILLLTSKGERIIHSDLGTNISVFSGELFEQINPTEIQMRLETEIRSTLEQWMSHIKLTNLEVILEGEEDDTIGIERNDVLIKMNYIIVDADNFKDSVQFRVGPAQ